jgi:hypothetical protein
MSLIIEIFITCDVCGENFGVDTRQRKGGEQRANAKNNGWLYSGNKDYCPNCRPKRNEGQNYAGINRKTTIK